MIGSQKRVGASACRRLALEGCCCRRARGTAWQLGTLVAEIDDIDDEHERRGLLGPRRSSARATAASLGIAPVVLSRQLETTGQRHRIRTKLQRDVVIDLARGGDDDEQRDAAHRQNPAEVWISSRIGHRDDRAGDRGHADAPRRSRTAGAATPPGDARRRRRTLRELAGISSVESSASALVVAASLPATTSAPVRYVIGKPMHDTEARA